MEEIRSGRLEAAGLPEYQFSWLRADIVAGLAAWAVLVTTSMAYAGIADVPPLVARS